MAEKKKLTLKDVKAPDEFQAGMAKAVVFLKDYGAWIGMGFTLVLLAIVGGIILSRQQESTRIEIARKFYEAQAPVTQTAWTLDNEENKNADELKKALEALEEFVKEHADSPLAVLARLQQGAAAFLAGDMKAAIQALNRFVEKQGTSGISFLAWEEMGHAAFASGDPKKAEEAYQEMAKFDSPLIRANAYMHLGDLYSPLGKSAPGLADAGKAKEFYEKGKKEIAGEESLLPPARLITRKMLEQRLAALK